MSSVAVCMRLDVFSIQRYRSIITAERLRLGDFTVLVGPNNEGKSNILQALVVGMTELSRSAGSRRAAPLIPQRMQGRETRDYNWKRDFPRSLQESARVPTTIMNFDFSLTDEEIEEFHD